jgi:hypothetical protein
MNTKSHLTLCRSGGFGFFLTIFHCLIIPSVTIKSNKIKDLKLINLMGDDVNHIVSFCAFALCLVVILLWT